MITGPDIIWFLFQNTRGPHQPGRYIGNGDHWQDEMETRSSLLGRAIPRRILRCRLRLWGLLRYGYELFHYSSSYGL